MTQDELTCPDCLRKCISEFDFLNHDCDFEKEMKKAEKKKRVPQVSRVSREAPWEVSEHRSEHRSPERYDEYQPEYTPWQVQRLIVENMQYIEENQSKAIQISNLEASNRHLFYENTTMGNTVAQLQKSVEALQARVNEMRDAPYAVQSRLEMEHQETLQQMIVKHNSEMTEMRNSHLKEMENLREKMTRMYEQIRAQSVEEHQSLVNHHQREAENYSARTQQLMESFEAEKRQRETEWASQMVSMEKKIGILEQALERERAETADKLQSAQQRYTQLETERNRVIERLSGQVELFQTSSKQTERKLGDLTALAEKYKKENADHLSQVEGLQRELEAEKTARRTEGVMLRKEMLGEIANKEKEIFHIFEERLEIVENKNISLVAENNQLMKKIQQMEILHQELKETRAVSESNLALFRSTKAENRELSAQLQTTQNELTSQKAQMEDFRVKTADKVQHLTAELERVNEERDRLGKRIEQLVGVEREYNNLKIKHNSMLETYRKSIQNYRLSVVPRLSSLPPANPVLEEALKKINDAKI